MFVSVMEELLFYDQGCTIDKAQVNYLEILCLTITHLEVHVQNKLS